MMKRFLIVALATSCLSGAVLADEVKKERTIGALEVTVKGIENGKPIDPKFAYCIPTEKEKSSMTGQNISPEISWSKGPEGTVTYVVLMVDKDVPADFTDAGKEGKTIPADAKRQDFYHWVVADITHPENRISEGLGKTNKLDTLLEGTPVYWMFGLNDYAKFMKDKPATTFFGYDGPCPPWNDVRTHQYHFQVYALDAFSNQYYHYTAKDKDGKDKKGVGFYELADGASLAKAIEPHILAKGEVVGTYSLNPELMKK